MTLPAEVGSCTVELDRTGSLCQQQLQDRVEAGSDLAHTFLGTAVEIVCYKASFLLEKSCLLVLHIAYSAEHIDDERRQCDYQNISVEAYCHSFDKLQEERRPENLIQMCPVVQIGDFVGEEMRTLHESYLEAWLTVMMVDNGPSWGRCYHKIPLWRVAEHLVLDLVVYLASRRLAAIHLVCLS